MEWKTYESKIESTTDEDYTITHAITSYVRDRIGDRLNPDGAKITARPAFLWSHGFDQRQGNVPIGQPLWIKPGAFRGVRALLVKSQFDADEFSRKLYEKVKGGSLSYFSIGFNPLKWDYFRDEAGGRDIHTFEIIEYSLCSTPCNVYTGVIQEKDFSALCYKIMPPGESKKTVTIPDSLIRKLTSPEWIRELVKEQIDKARGRVS
jgi:HK97 family phage prohead protease